MKPPLHTFRLAQPFDLASLGQIDVRCRGDDRRLRLEQAALELRLHVVAEGDGIRGFGLLNHEWFGHPLIELLVVHHEHRRRGLGRALLRQLVGAAGRGRVFASTNESNLAMRQLLTAEGFTPSGTIHNLDEADVELVFVRLPGDAG